MSNEVNCGQDVCRAMDHPKPPLLSNSIVNATRDRDNKADRFIRISLMLSGCRYYRRPLWLSRPLQGVGVDQGGDMRGAKSIHSSVPSAEVFIYAHLGSERILQYALELLSKS